MFKKFHLLKHKLEKVWNRDFQCLFLQADLKIEFF